MAQHLNMSLDDAVKRSNAAEKSARQSARTVINFQPIPGMSSSTAAKLYLPLDAVIKANQMAGKHVSKTVSVIISDWEHDGVLMA